MGTDLISETLLAQLARRVPLLSREGRRNAFSAPWQFCTPSRDVPDWVGHKFASLRFQDKKDQAVNVHGDRSTDFDYDTALSRVRECIVEINYALDAALASPGELSLA